MDKIRPIAYYLPQFHRLKFNDDYWGKGFTEWTNTAKAKPLFKGHYQPHVPADLGFYDLSLSSIREEQAALARDYGIYGFCYWHYWFSKGYQVMEMPFQEVLKSGKPDFPFCLAWANHDWHNLKTKEVILRQQYGGKQDYEAHFYALLQAFRDFRYITYDGCPIFVIFDPSGFKDFERFKEIWDALARQNGLKGFFFVGIVKEDEDIEKTIARGYDAVNTIRLGAFYKHISPVKRKLDIILHKLYKHPNVWNFSDVMKYFINDNDKKENVIPTIISGWDHTPRSGQEALVFDKCTPAVFSMHVRKTFECIKDKNNKFCFIRAWNEWAEGNHLEPDLKYGTGFLKAIRDNLSRIYQNES